MASVAAMESAAHATARSETPVNNAGAAALTRDPVYLSFTPFTDASRTTPPSAFIAFEKCLQEGGRITIGRKVKGQIDGAEDVDAQPSPVSPAAATTSPAGAAATNGVTSATPGTPGAAAVVSDSAASPTTPAAAAAQAPASVGSSSPAMPSFLSPRLANLLRGVHGSAAVPSAAAAAAAAASPASTSSHQGDETVPCTPPPTRTPQAADVAVAGGRAPPPPPPPLQHDHVWFQSKVVSRIHGELWLRDGQVYLKDTGSSSGTFLNHLRLSPTGKKSRPYPLRDGDVIQLGIDYQGRTEDIYKAVIMKIAISGPMADFQTRRRENPVKFRLALQSLLAASNPYASTEASDALTRHNQSDPGIDQPSAAASVDCCICLSGIGPFQALFLAPCSHCYHYKCIRNILEEGYMFLCPLCRQVANLDASVSMESLPLSPAEPSDEPVVGVRGPPAPRSAVATITAAAQAAVAAAAATAATAAAVVSMDERPDHVAAADPDINGPGIHDDEGGAPDGAAAHNDRGRGLAAPQAMTQSQQIAQITDALKDLASSASSDAAPGAASSAAAAAGAVGAIIPAAASTATVPAELSETRASAAVAGSESPQREAGSRASGASGAAGQAEEALLSPSTMSGTADSALRKRCDEHNSADCLPRPYGASEDAIAPPPPPEAEAGHAVAADRVHAA